MVTLPIEFPFRDKFEEFLSEYSHCSTYWYVPKTRTLTDKNIKAIQGILSIVFEEFLDCMWNAQNQDRLLRRLIEKNILEPYKDDGTLADRTALIRIWKKMLETLGLLWVQENKEIIITDVGLDVLVAKNPRLIIEGQVAKIQYPNPTLGTEEYRKYFKGILPHLFLLQVLRECNYRMTFEEYELFANLAQDQEDLKRIVSYIVSWRDLNEDERKMVLELAQKIPLWEDSGQLEIPYEDIPQEEANVTRYRRIHLNSSYQRALYTYPSYLSIDTDKGESYIRFNITEQINELLEQKLRNLKLTLFLSLEDWFAYFGDPSQKPSWFTYLALEVEKASTEKEASRLVEENKEQLERLTEEEQGIIRKKQIEKKIEDFYVDCLGFLEDGLALLKNGRQYSTPIGRIDLLCKGKDGKYVVVEIKTDEADDAVFGQILRYIGWIHRNMDDGRNNVRGVILAGKFPETARYSRIGLLREDHKDFLKFAKHGLYVQNT